MTDQNQINTVDSMLPIPQLFAFGLQHVLAMYAGAVAVPIIVAQAMNLPVEDLIRLITADLFTCGIATLIQTLGFGNIGGRIPMIQGVTFASVGPMTMIGAQHGMTAIYGAIIVAGLFTFLVAPFFSRLIRLFPPVVTGTIITLIGINLMPVAINWMGGGVGNPEFGSYTNIGLGFLTFLIVVFVYKFAKGFLSNLSVLIGLIAGTAIAFAMGVANFDEVGRSQWVAFIEPFYFGLPTFDWASVLSMIIVMLVVMVETTGDSIAIGEIVDKPIGRKELASVIRADGISTLIGGILNSFPYTAFAQNVGLIAVTGIPFYSMCEHHLLPFFGTVDIVYQPKDGCVAGLSKFQDVVNILSRRPQLQERLASELADAIMNDLSAHGVFVRITSTQLCMLIKGTMQQDSKVITLESRGVLAETGTVRDEALAMLGGGQVNV